MPERAQHTGKLANQSWMLTDTLGHGGAGIVYGCQHTKTGQRGALKLLRTNWEEDDELLERFFQEVHILRRLRHPNIVEIYDVGFQEDLGFFLVMELLHGMDLRDRAAQSEEPLPWNELSNIVCQVCDAAAFAHNKGVIHRDLKPANIFLHRTSEGHTQVKLLDFGIAKALTRDDVQITQTGMMVGSPAYLSPEQAMGEAIDHRADIYSLSVILFELLTQKTLFEPNNSFRYMMNHVYATPQTISEARPDLRFPKGLEALVAEGLEKQPAQRPQGMESFKQKFLDALAGKYETSASQDALQAAQSQDTQPGTYRLTGRVTPPPFRAPSTSVTTSPRKETASNPALPSSAAQTAPASLRLAANNIQTNTPLPTRKPQQGLVSSSSSHINLPAAKAIPSQQELPAAHDHQTGQTPVLPHTSPDQPTGPQIRPASRDQRMAPVKQSASRSASRSRRSTSSAMWNEAHEEELKKRRTYLAISFVVLTILLLIAALIVGR